MSSESLFPNIPSQWKVTTLGELAKTSGGDIQTGPFGSQLHASDYVDDGIPSIMPKNISVDVVTTDDIARVSPKDVERLSKYKVEVGDIVYSRRGDVEKCARITEKEDGWLCGTGCLRVRVKPESVSTEYLHAYLCHPTVREWIVRHAVGATMPNLNTSILSALPVVIPSNTEMATIASVWLTISDKIQLNHRINQTLEEIAQALFKSWFVDFEPVKAKVVVLEAGGSKEDALLAAMEAVSGKTANQLAMLSADQPERYAELRATAELFPSTMQDSELGEIPEGWSCLPLDTIAKYQNGLALQKYRPENEDDYLPVVKIAQLKKGFADGEEKASPNIKSGCIIDDGDVVFSWSGSLMVDTWCGGKAAMNQHLFKVTSTDYPKWLYYHFTRHHLEEFQRIAESKAVTMGHIKRQHLREALCAIPDKPLLQAIGHHLGDQLSQQITLRLETKTLSKLRDTLLPKLLSGELTLPDVNEAQAEPQDVAHV